MSKESKKKLEPTTEKVIFVGYNETSQAHKVYIPSLKKTVIRQDVRLEEDKALRKSLQREQVGVLGEELLTPKQEPQLVSQIECQPGGKQVVQQDDKESL